jgi:hypothetical protein
MTVVLAAIGAKALWLLYLWLASAIACQWLAEQKGYTEKAGLGTGLLLSVLGVPIWLFMRPRPNSKWANRRSRRRSSGGADDSAITPGGDSVSLPADERGHSA